MKKRWLDTPQVVAFDASSSIAISHLETEQARESSSCRWGRSHGLINPSWRQFSRLYLIAALAACRALLLWRFGFLGWGSLVGGRIGLTRHGGAYQVMGALRIDMQPPRPEKRLHPSRD